MEQEILLFVNHILSNKGLKEITELLPEFDLRNDIGFDSFDLAELTVRIENKFGVDIFEDSDIRLVQDIYRKLNNG